MTNRPGTDRLKTQHTERTGDKMNDCQCCGIHVYADVVVLCDGCRPDGDCEVSGTWHCGYGEGTGCAHEECV